MKELPFRYWLTDRLLLFLLVLSLAAVIVMSVLFLRSRDMEARNADLAAQISAIHSSAGDVANLRKTVSLKMRSMRSGRARSVVATLEGILEDLGLEASAMKSLDRTTLDEFTEENAEVELEDVDLNSIVNVLFHIENSPAALKLKSLSMRTTFENPALFDVKMTLSLMTENQQRP